MTKQRRRFGKATRAIIDPGTGRVLGWTYRWDNGEGSTFASADVPADLQAVPDASGQGSSGTDEEEGS